MIYVYPFTGDIPLLQLQETLIHFPATEVVQPDEVKGPTEASKKSYGWMMYPWKTEGVATTRHVVPHNLVARRRGRMPSWIFTPGSWIPSRSLDATVSKW